MLGAWCRVLGGRGGWVPGTERQWWVEKAGCWVPSVQWQSPGPVPLAQRLHPPAQVFVEALRDPRPALRYFSTESFLPWTRRLLDDPSGRCFVAAAHRHFFQGQQDDPGEEVAGARAQAGPCAPSAAAAQK